MSAFSLTVGMVLLGLGVLAPQAAQAATAGFSSGDPNVTIAPGGSNCNGVIPPKKTDTNTDKTLTGFDANDPNKPMYAVTYPSDPNNAGTFTVLDCMLTGNAGDDLKAMTEVAEATFTKVNSGSAFIMDFTVDLTALNPQPGQQFCNVAKTTSSPSKSPAGVRKAGASCFVVGGDQRVEKVDASTGNVITSGTPATFRIGCVNSAADPALQPVIVNTTNVPVGSSIDVQANTLAFNGPSGSTCTVQEIAAPTGYQLPTAGVCAGAVVPPACDTIALTIGVGAAQNVISFGDTPTPVARTRSLTVSKAITGGTGSFALHVDCNDGTTHDANYTVTTNTTEPAITGIPDGTSCTVSEDDPGAGWSTTLNGTSGRSATVTMDQDRTEAFVNTFTPAPVTRTLTVSKTVSGGTGSFAIHALCDDGSKADYTITKTVTEPALTGIKDGASCTVSEDDPGTGWSTTVNGNSGRSVTVTMTQDRTAAFVNTFTPAAVVVPPVTTTTQPPAEVLAEVIAKPAAPAAAAAPAATPAAAPTVAAAELPKTGRELGFAARVGGVMIALGLMALAASGRKREASAVQ